jgi:hypothetical protein
MRHFRRTCRSRCASAAATLLVLICAARAAEIASPAAAPADIERLVARLAGNNWLEYQQAQAALVELGPAAVPALEELARRATDRELAGTIELVIRQITVAEQLKPTLVSLRVQDAPVDQVLADLAKQAQTQIILPASTPGRRGGMGMGGAGVGAPTSQPVAAVTLDVQRQPFWTVLRQVCSQAGLAPLTASTEGQRGVTVHVAPSATPWADGPTCISKGFYFTYGSAVGTAPGAPPGAFPFREPIRPGFTLNMFADPRVRIVACDRIVNVLEALDPRGNSLVWPQAETATPPATNSAWYVPLSVTLVAPPEGTTRLVSFRGSVRVSVVEEVDTWVMDQILTTAPLTRETPMGVFTVNKPTGAEGGWTVETVLQFQPGREPAVRTDYWEPIPMTGSMRLVDAAGRSLRSTSLRINNVAGGQYTAHDARWGSNRYVFTFSNMVPGRGGGGGMGGMGLGDGRPGGAAAMSGGTTMGPSRTLYAVAGYAGGIIGSGGFAPPPQEIDIPFGEPVKLIWDIPVKVRQIVVPIEFKDLPWP